MFQSPIEELLNSNYIKIGEVEMSNRPTVYSARNLSSTKIIWIMSIMPTHTASELPKKSHFLVRFARKCGHLPKEVYFGGTNQL